MAASAAGQERHDNALNTVVRTVRVVD